MVPYGEHEAQVNLYGYMLEELGFEVKSLAIQYISKRGPTECKKCRKPVEWTYDGLACPTCLKVFATGHLGVMLVEIHRYTHAEMEENSLQAGEPGRLCMYCKHECDVREG